MPNGSPGFVPRRLKCGRLRRYAEPEAVAVARRTGCGTTRRMVAAVLRVGTGEARTRVAVAEQLGPRRSLTGEPLPPRCPATAAAFAAGEISFLAARIVTDALGAVPSSVHPDEVAAAEATLAGHARIFEPAPLAKVARHLVACLDPDGAEPKEPGPRQARELH